MSNDSEPVSQLRSVFGMLVTAAVFISFFSIFPPPVFSQNSSLRGVVTEKGTDTTLEKVKVIIVSLRTATARYELFTDKKGSFYKGGLQNGMYRVSFEKEGYVPAQSAVRLRAEDRQEITVQLEKMEVKAAKAAFDLVNAAQKLMAAGKYDEAIVKITQAIEKDAGSFILYYNRAVCCEKKGDKEKAIVDYRKSLELKPDFLLSLSALGKIFAKKGDFAKAVEYYQKAFDLEITDTVALYNYGACLINLGNSGEAKSVFEKLISLDPNYADAFYQLGILYLGLNENAKAKEYFKTFLELDPENENAPVAREILKTLQPQ
jgi:tetratricopeptide (TPR) repeat protein